MISVPELKSILYSAHHGSWHAYTGVLNPVTALVVVSPIRQPSKGPAEHSHHDREGKHSKQQPLNVPCGPR